MPNQTSHLKHSARYPPSLRDLRGADDARHGHQAIGIGYM